jgi:predicted NUDIX family NTP pyrophosphohydrolase
MTDAERLARAVLLFHGGGPWTDHERAIWHALTGEHEATTRALCDLARRMLMEDYG